MPSASPFSASLFSASLFSASLFSASLLRRLTVGAGALGISFLASVGLTAPAQATPAHRQPAQPAVGLPHASSLLTRSAAGRLTPLHVPVAPAARTAGPARPGDRSRRARPAASAPLISSMIPAQGAPGWPVTLSGHHFRHITKVSFGGVSASFEINSATQITTAVPGGATSGPVTVTGKAGSGRSATFTVTPVTTLEPGETMPPGSALSSRDGHFTLAMRRDGNLTYSVTGTGQTLWATGTAGHPGAYLSMLSNGNLVLYDRSGAKTLWSTGTAGHGPADLVAQANGNLVLYDGTTTTWNAGSLDNKLTAGEVLQPGWYLNSGTGYRLVMRTNGNLVQTHGGRTVWSSGTAGHPGATLTMRASGNLVVAKGTTLWASGTGRHAGARLIDQRDGVVAVRAAGKVLWASRKAPPPASGLTLGQWKGRAGPGAASKYYGYPYADPPACTDKGACVADKWAFYQGQCTSWVAFEVNHKDGIAFTNSYGGKGRWGNAVDWATRARALKLTVNTTPAVGSIAWYDSTKAAPDGHVAFVEKVNSPTSIVISEMNYDGDNGFWVHTITVKGDWPSAFIHLAGH